MLFASLKQSERNLNIAQGREMSRKQLAQFCGDSESEDSPPANPERMSSGQDQDEAEPPAAVEPVEEQSPEPALEKQGEQE